MNIQKTKSSRSTAMRQLKVGTARQHGAALVITLVVLLGMTLLALASTSSNQSQSIMVRNSQFRLEAYNTSYAEIDAQIDTINRRAISLPPPVYVEQLITEKGNFRVTKGNSGLQIYSAAETGYMNQDVSHSYHQPCIVFGQQEGAGSRRIVCDRIQIESKADLVNTKVESDQRQIYEYLTLGN